MMQQVEIASINIKGKNFKKTLISLIIISTVILGGLYIFNQVSTQNAENIFLENAKAVNELMLIGGANAELVSNLMMKVWYNAIYEENDSETDEYTIVSGEFVEDFNTAIYNYQLSDNYTNSMILLENNIAEVDLLMKSLQNSPEKFTLLYTTISDLYSTYTSLLDSAMDPTGNYTSYSDDVNKNIDEFMKLYKKVETQLP